MKKERMFWAAVLFLLVLFTAVVNMSLVYAQSPNWEYAPYNWKNVPDNFVNTVYDWNNNPYNWKNSSYNWNSPNGLYDAQGSREGYLTINNEGTVNIFDNDGSRLVYGR